MAVRAARNQICSIQQIQRSRPHEEVCSQVRKVRRHADVVPVDVGEDDAVNVVRCQAAPSKRGDDVRRGAHWLAGRDVFADRGGVCRWVAAKAKVEEQASCFGGCGTGGVLDKEGNLVTDLSAREIDEMFADGTISGGMLPKISSALDAAKSGVNTVHIIDGRIEHSLLLEVLTEQAFGTMIRSH